MADSDRETALKALRTALDAAAAAVDWPAGLSGEPAVLRSAPFPEELPASGLIHMGDGDPGEPEVLLSPATWIYTHSVPIEVSFQSSDDALRDTGLDRMLQAIGAAIDADDTLGGAVDLAEPSAPQDIALPDVPGTAGIKSALVTVTMTYASPTPL